MSTIDRDKAVKRAHGYLSQNGANQWAQGQELRRRTQESVGYMDAVQLVADIYQRGERPGDLFDLQTIDFSLSYDEIKSNINEKLDELGAEQFDNIKEQELEAQMERMEAMVEEEREQMENKREDVQEEVDELTEEEQEGRLYQARNQAWTGYRLALLDSRGMFDTLVEAIEYARAILEIDEQLGENFDPDEMDRGAFSQLKQRAEKMREFAAEIEGLNFEAEEIDQSAVGEEEEETGEDPEDVEEVIRRTLEAEDGPMGRFELINQVEGQTAFSEEEIETKLEELETIGEIFQPTRGDVELLDHEVALERDISIIRDHRGQLQDVEQDVLTQQPYGDMTVQVVQTGEPPEVNTFSELQEFLEGKIGGQTREHFMAIFLDASGDVISTQTIGVGGLNNVSVEKRPIIQSGILTNASGVILAHNHPSGVLEFTSADFTATQELQEEMAQFDLSLLDHVLATSDGVKSMRDAKTEIFSAPEPSFYAE